MRMREIRESVKLMRQKRRTKIEIMKGPTRSSPCCIYLRYSTKQGYRRRSKIRRCFPTIYQECRATPSPTFSASQERSRRIQRSRNASHAGKYIITHSLATPFARSPGYKSANTPHVPLAMSTTTPPTRSHQLVTLPSLLPHRLFDLSFLYRPPFPRTTVISNMFARWCRVGISSTSCVFSAILIITFEPDDEWRSNEVTRKSVPKILYLNRNKSKNRIGLKEERRRWICVRVFYEHS